MFIHSLDHISIISHILMNLSLLEAMVVVSCDSVASELRGAVRSDMPAAMRLTATPVKRLVISLVLRFLLHSEEPSYVFSV